MRKIAYLLNWDSTWGSGILKKVLRQTRVWLDLGYEVKVFMLSRHDEGQDPSTGVDPGIPLVIRKSRNIPDRFVQYYPLLQMLYAWNPDIVYLRYEGCYPALVSLARRIPTVVEINTDDVYEYQLVSVYHDWYNRLTRTWLLSQVSGIVFVSNELSKKPHFVRFGKPSTLISNGIDLSGYEELPPANNPHPRLVFIGSPEQLYHGAEKIRVLAERCPTWEFDLIGTVPSELGGPIPPNITLHGFLDRPRYQPIFARADVALGTLALHLKRMEEASPLKVREYLAFGVPTVIGYQDTDFPQPNPYILQLPNTPDNIITELDTIRQFVERVKGKRIPRALVAHLDVQHKEHQRLEFFRSVVEQSTRQHERSAA